MSVGEHDINRISSEIVKGFSGEIVGLTAATVKPVGVGTVSMSGSLGRAIAVKITPSANLYVSMLTTLSGLNGLFIPAHDVDAADRPTIHLAPSVNTIYLISPSASSAHLSWFIGA